MGSGLDVGDSAGLGSGSGSGFCAGARSGFDAVGGSGLGAGISSGIDAGAGSGIAVGVGSRFDVGGGSGVVGRGLELDSGIGSTLGVVISVPGAGVASTLDAELGSQLPVGGASNSKFDGILPSFAFTSLSKRSRSEPSFFSGNLSNPTACKLMVRVSYSCEVTPLFQCLVPHGERCSTINGRFPPITPSKRQKSSLL